MAQLIDRGHAGEQPPADRQVVGQTQGLPERKPRPRQPAPNVRRGKRRFRVKIDGRFLPGQLLAPPLETGVHQPELRQRRLTQNLRFAKLQYVPKPRIVLEQINDPQFQNVTPQEGV